MQQRQALPNQRDSDAAIVRIRPVKDEDVETIGVLDSVSFGVPGLDHDREKRGSAAGRTGISVSLVADAAMSISQVDCKE